MPGKILDLRLRLPEGAILIRLGATPLKSTYGDPKKLEQVGLGSGMGHLHVATKTCSDARAVLPPVLATLPSDLP